MINLLFLTSMALASDVYEVCIFEKQVWIESWRDWKTDFVWSFYGNEPIQFIVHDNVIEVNRTKSLITSREIIDGNQCYREHEHSVVCHHKKENLFIWEFQYKNGKIVKDILTVCGENGE